VATGAAPARLASGHIEVPPTSLPRPQEESGRLDRPGFLGGYDLWEGWGSWYPGIRIPLSCGNEPPGNVTQKGVPVLHATVASGRGPLDMTAVPRRRSISMRSLPTGLVRKQVKRTGLLVPSHAGSHGEGAWSV
jgi:hypothetical protein